MRRRHPGDGPHLGIADHAVPERRIDARQSLERPAYADALPRGAGSQAAAVVEPVAEIAVAALAPSPGAVHGGDELDEAPVGEVDVGRHAGDGAAQLGEVVGNEIEVVGVCFEDEGIDGGFWDEVEMLDNFFGRDGHVLRARYTGFEYCI